MPPGGAPTVQFGPWSSSVGCTAVGTTRVHTGRSRPGSRIIPLLAGPMLPGGRHRHAVSADSSSPAAESIHASSARAVKPEGRAPGRLGGASTRDARPSRSGGTLGPERSLPREMDHHRPEERDATRSTSRCERRSWPPTYARSPLARADAKRCTASTPHLRRPVSTVARRRAGRRRSRARRLRHGPGRAPQGDLEPVASSPQMRADGPFDGRCRDAEHDDAEDKESCPVVRRRHPKAAA